MPSWGAGRAPMPKPTKPSCRRCGRASSSARQPTAPGASGAMCWARASPAACTGSSGDACSSPAGAATAARLAQGRGLAAGQPRAQHAWPPVHGVAPEPEVDRRLHLRLDGRRLALCGGCHQSVLTPRCRLVDEGRDDRAARRRRSRHRDLAARQAGRIAAPFGPRPPNTPAHSSSR